MSTFSDLLSQLIDSKNIKVYDLSRYLEIDRSSIYQVMKGKRNPPSEEIVEKIAEYMLLTPSESEELQRQAEITRLGLKTYYKREGVARFLCDFPDDLAEYWNELNTPQLNENTPESEYTCLYLPTESDINLLLRRILLKEFAKEEGCIRLLLQPGRCFLFDTLKSLPPHQNFKVEHILCISSNDEMADDKTLYNIRYLNTIIPLYVRNGMDYKAYYYYDNIEAHFLHNNGLSGMILTDDTAILLTMDFSQGIVLRDKAVVDGMNSLFASYQNNCRELLQAVTVNMLDFSQIREANDTVTNKVSCYIMEREVCLLPLLSRDIIAAYLHPAIPARDEMVENLSAMLEGNRKMLGSQNMHLYFTREGLEYFAQTGKLKELPDEIYIPLAPEGRKQMLQDLVKYCRKGTYRMLTGRLNHLARNLRLCINGDMGYLMFTGEGGQVTYMFLTEQSLLSIFSDFIENIRTQDFYTNEATAALIEELCAQL